MKITSRRKNFLIGVGIFLAVLLGFWIVLRDRPPRYNEPLAGRQSGTPLADDPALRGMWPDKVDQDDTTLMMVAFSGGGSRAAAVGWKTLETLKRIPYTFYRGRTASGIEPCPGDRSGGRHFRRQLCRGCLVSMRR
jgi:hypothetical protein